jgi:hypothetical protein
VLTRGAKTTDGGVTWMECTGIAAVNGDLIDTVTWAQAKAIGTPSLGTVIQRNNGASYWICTTAGALGASEPAWANDTAGTTQADSTTTWTCLGVVGNFTGGQVPHARLANAFGANWAISNVTVYVGDNHAETQASGITLTPSTASQIAPVFKIVCHDHAGSYPPASANLKTTATITATASNITFNPVTGTFYCYGLTFKSGNYLLPQAGAGATVIFDSCSLQLTGTGFTGIWFGSGSTSNYLLTNTTVSFGSINQGIAHQTCNLVWQNTAPILASGSLVPTYLFNDTSDSNALFATLTLEALDLSQINTNLCLGTINQGTVTIKDCKLNSSVTLVSAASNLASNWTVSPVRSDSGATAYKSARYALEGTETTETSITRVGGASDPTGQAQSRKIVTTANSQWLRPFKAEPYAIWNAVTGANVTVTIYGTINAGALPNNDDIWMEVEYLGSSASPLGTIVNTTKANLLAANAAVASDSSTWNGGGSGAGWSPFKLTATLTSPQPGTAGLIYVRPSIAKPSTAFYLDPNPVLS